MRPVRHVQTTEVQIPPSMRILHVITGLARGGAETMLLKLLVAGGGEVEPAVVSLGREERALESRVKDLGIPVYCLELRKIAPNPFSIITLGNIIRRVCPDLIQGWMYHGNLMASLAAYSSRRSVPVLWNIRQSFYGLAYERWLTRRVIRLGALLSVQPDAIIYNSLSSARQHEAIGYERNKRVWIPNGFDCDTFQPREEWRSQVRCELGIADDVVLVGVIARYHPMKDHEGFLRAAGLVVQNHPNVRFLFAGRGVTSDQPALLRAIRQNQLGNFVFLLGERTDVPRLNAALDLACSASAWGEGFSNAIGEAMASGIPCVVTDIGDSAHIVGDTGTVVPPRNFEELARAISRLIGIGQIRRRQNGEQARKRIEKEFSLAAIVQRYHILYRQHLTRQ